MAILINAHKITKSFSARPLFVDISFTIESGEKIGLIGPNGAGKSTLMQIIAGKQSVDSGTLSRAQKIKISFLPQVPEFNATDTIYSAVKGDLGDDWEDIAAIDEYISKLSLNQNGLTEETPVALLSGGLKKRVALARELVKKPDLFLLDEPTNHLDVESILMLEDLINRATFTTLTVTHDRLFLQRIASRILELDRRNPDGLLSVRGDYTQYLETKDQMMVAQERREIILKNTLRRETEWLRRGAKARTTKQQARITRHGELSDEVAELNYRNQNRTARIDFISKEKNPKRLLEAENISKSYDSKILFKNLSLLLSPGSRIGLLGANGCGKSTLIRILLGDEKADSGSVFKADNLTIAYFEQNREVLDPDATLSETLCPRGEYVEYNGAPVHIKGYLDRFLFTKEQANMSVRYLSGGEQSRVLIAKLMLQPANILVLDEPTNDLDMVTLSILEECLKEFKGAVLLVTHDRYFLDQVATKIIAFPKSGGECIQFTNLEQWEDWMVESSKAKSTPTNIKLNSEDKSNHKKLKLSFNEQKELSTMESTIHKLEAELAKLSAESALIEHASNAKKLNELAKAMADHHTKIDHLYHRWDELLKKQ